MDLKEYLYSQKQRSNINESFVLAILSGCLFGGLFGRLFGMFSKKDTENFDRSWRDNIGGATNELGELNSAIGGREEKENEDGTTSEKVVSLEDMSIEDQETWMLKTQVLMHKYIDKDPDSEESKRATALLNQVNACMYDENGNLRSEEDRKKFCEENMNGIEQFNEFTNGLKDAAEKVAFTQKSELKQEFDFDSISNEDIEKQKEKCVESAKSTLKKLEEAKKEDPDTPPFLNLMKASGYNKDDLHAAKIGYDAAMAADKMEMDKAKADEEFNAEKAEIIRKNAAGDIDDDEKDNQLKEAEKKKDDAYKKADDDFNNTIKELEKEADGEVNVPEPEKKTESKPEKKEDDNFKDNDGNEYRKDGDKYYMKDKNGDEIEIEKKDFETAEKERTNDDETEDETNSSTFEEDPENDEVDDKGDSKKDPHKVWKKKSYKRGNKTFKTKSYYNKNGDSISANEFKEKVSSFAKNQKQKNESFIDLYSYIKMILG